MWLERKENVKMKVDIKCPNITQYHFSLEPSDELYTACTWARINLDHDTYTMTATSDCGDYTYTWCITPTESFTHLMARLDREYLLGKISNENVFEFKESKNQLMLMKCDYEFNDDQIWDIDNLVQCGEEMFINFCMSELNIHLDDIPICKRYPYGAQTFVKIFIQYLQPLLREEIKKPTQDGWTSESHQSTKPHNCTECRKDGVERVCKCGAGACEHYKEATT